MKRFENSTYGRALLAINEDEIGAEALGINVFSNKVKAFVLSSFFAGIGGGLMASVLGTIDPNTFKSTLTYTAVTICVLGGERQAQLQVDIIWLAQQRLAIDRLGLGPLLLVAIGARDGGQRLGTQVAILPWASYTCSTSASWPAHPAMTR